MREKSVLLTTLGSSGDDRLDYQYFYYDDHGRLSYCNSLSVAEAGTKYILSQKNIDEIIVLGSGASYNPEDALRPQVLRNFEDYSAEGIENLPQLIQENRGLTADIRGRNVQVLKGYSNMQEPEVQQVPFMEQMWE